MAATPESRRWAAAGVAAVLLVFVVDQLTSVNVALVTLSAVGPLIAAAGARLRQTLAVAVLATGLALVGLALAGPLGLQDGVRVLTVLVVSTLAVVLAGLRERLEQRSVEARTATRQAEETLALLDVIFARSPVGLAFHGLDGRYVRINDHLAEINGRPPEDHIGHTLAEILPELPEVGDDVRRVAVTGRPATGVEVRGETPAQPGVEREWVASYWPVRATPGGDLIGVGAVVFDVTDRRAAERALRTQTDRYETLLEALSEVGEGMVVIEDGRCVYANHAFEQLSGYTFPELTALESLYELVDEEERAEAERRAGLRRSAIRRHHLRAGDPAPRRRPRDLDVAGVPLEIAGRRRSQLVVVVRDITARSRAEAEREQRWRGLTLLAEASALFDQSLDEERTLERRRACVRDLADTCVVMLGSHPGPARRTIAVARDPAREQALAAGSPRATAAPPTRSRRSSDGRSAYRRRTHLVPLTARGRALGRSPSASTGSSPTSAGRSRPARGPRPARRARDRQRPALRGAHAIATDAAGSLLPPVLPRIPGASSRPATAPGDGNEVGGDFYDCFATGATTGRS